MVSMIASGPSCLWFNSQHSQRISEDKIIDVAKVNQWCWLHKSGQWLENVDQTHLVLPCGKPVLQKIVGLNLGSCRAVFFSLSSTPILQQFPQEVATLLIFPLKIFSCAALAKPNLTCVELNLNFWNKTMPLQTLRHVWTPTVGSHSWCSS